MMMTFFTWYLWFASFLMSTSVVLVSVALFDLVRNSPDQANIAVRVVAFKARVPALIAMYVTGVLTLLSMVVQSLTR